LQQDASLPTFSQRGGLSDFAIGCNTFSCEFTVIEQTVALRLMNSVRSISLAATRLVFVAWLMLLSGCNPEESQAPKKVEESAAASGPAAESAAAASALLSAGPSAPPALPPLNLQLGGGYNEQFANINNEIVAKSGVRWVRAYVNLARNYWIFANTFPPPQPLPTPNPWPTSAITGIVEGNLIQQPSNVSTDADTLAVAALDQLINTKTVLAKGTPVKVILSLKHDFSYPYPPKATISPNQFPDFSTPAGKAEIDQMVDSIVNLLTTNNRGDSVDIVVTGNEPMFEIQPNNNPDTARKYKLYLNHLIAELVALKAQQNMLPTNSWDFQIFVGALNSRLDATTAAANVIIPAVLEVARDNVNVDGIDLHEHVADPAQVRTDIQYVKDNTKFRPLGAQPLQLISSEFSMIKLFEANMTTAPNSGPVLFTFINNTINQAATGTPVSPDDFLAYFLAQSWYQPYQNWFSQMIEAFEAEGVLAVTYGIEETPRYPWNLNNLLAPTATPWVLNGVFNATLLGRQPDGFPTNNPLVAPGFQQTIQRQ